MASRATRALARGWQHNWLWQAVRSAGSGASPWAERGREAADELVGCEGHPFVTGRPVEPIVLVPEGDAILVGGDEAAIGDSDAVGIARQIVQNLLWPGERSFAVD